MKSAALYNLKGGVGKTTASVHLAHLWARAGKQTLLWDLDPQGAASWFFRVRVGEATRPRRLLRDRDELWKAIRGSDWPDLDILPADLSLTALEAALGREGKPERAIGVALAELGNRYDRIVLDCPPALSTLTRSLFGGVDALVVPTIPTPLSLRTLTTLYPQLKPFRREGLIVLPFFSMVDPRKSVHRRVREFARAERLGFLAAEIPYSAHVESSAARRQPLTASGKHPATALFEALREEVEGHLETGSQDKLGRRRLMGLVERLGRPERRRR